MGMKQNAGGVTMEQADWLDEKFEEYRPHPVSYTHLTLPTN